MSDSTPSADPQKAKPGKSFDPSEHNMEIVGMAGLGLALVLVGGWLHSHFRDKTVLCNLQGHGDSVKCQAENFTQQLGDIAHWGGIIWLVFLVLVGGVGLVLRERG